jgi:hypothetical protein
MDEEKLIEKLRLIEALFSGAATVGERDAAARARERILERLARFEKEDPPLEYRFSMGDMWSRKVFVALLRRYGVKPYRYTRQRHTTVMARVSKRFVDETLWPEFREISDTLMSYLSEVTDRVVSGVIHQDSSEAEVVDDPLQLPADAIPPPTDNEPEKPTESPSQTDHEAVPASTTGQSSKKRKRRKRSKKRKR